MIKLGDAIDIYHELLLDEQLAGEATLKCAANCASAACTSVSDRSARCCARISTLPINGRICSRKRDSLRAFGLHTTPVCAMPNCADSFSSNLRGAVVQPRHQQRRSLDEFAA